MSELNGLPFQQLLSPLFVLVQQLTVLHPRLSFDQTRLFPHIFLGSAGEFGDIDSSNPRRWSELPLRIDRLSRVTVKQLNGISDMQIHHLRLGLDRRRSLTGSRRLEALIIRERDFKRIDFFLNLNQAHLNFNSHKSSKTNQSHIQKIGPWFYNFLQQIQLMMNGIAIPIGLQQRDELLRKIQEEIMKIGPGNGNSNAQGLQKKAILQQRLKLLANCKQYSQTRLSNIEKIFKHYSTHLFRSGQQYDFDQIGYHTDHMIMERFFAFVNDFKLNEIRFNGEDQQLADRNDIILIFKKSSSNARNLDLPEFIACLERLFVFLFNENQGFGAKLEKAKKQKQARLFESKKREKLKKDKERKEKEKLAKKNSKKSIIIAKPPKLQLSSQSPSLPLPQTVSQNQPVKSENPELVPPPLAPPKQNDEMMRQMLKDFQIVNPTDEIKTAVQQISPQNQIAQPNDPLYQITDPEKIESYMQRIGIDDKKEIQKKLRYFQKANYKYYEVEELSRYREGEPRKKDQEKGNQPLNLKKELTQMHDQWKNKKLQREKSNVDRFLNVMEKLSHRQSVKSELHMSRSLSRENYENKRKKMDDRFNSRQLDLMCPTAKQRITNKRKQEENTTAYFSLEMLHRSSPNQLPINKIYPDRYVNADPTDHIYLHEYGFPKTSGNRVVSGLTNRGKSEIGESTKRRAAEIQNQQTKRLNRLTVNLVQNHHYLQKFLEKKW